MNKEIKFRGKNNKGEWLFGNLIDVCDGMISIVPSEELAETPLDLIGLRFIEGIVRRETVGQWTGMTDRKGIAIYEGDIVEAWSEGRKVTGEVRRRKDGLWLIWPVWQHGEFWTFCPEENGQESVEVVGNVYEKESEEEKR